MDSEEKPGLVSQELTTIPQRIHGQCQTTLERFPPQISNVAADASRLDQIERSRFAEACVAWLMRSASAETHKAYRRDVQHFLHFRGINPEQLVQVRPLDVAAWRDTLVARGLANTSVGRKITVLRSLFAYLQVHGFASINPAHRDFVATPPVPRDGKTVGLSPEDCRRLLDAPNPKVPVGLRDNRGYVNTIGQRIISGQLQWVHGLITVVMSRITHYPGERNRLQWVHGLITVVMRTGANHCRWKQGRFNGSTV